MPQMMPMLWFFMINFTMMTMLIIIIFIHFFNLPMTLSSLSQTQNMYKLTNWNWLW